MKSARITRLLPLSLALMLAIFLTACGPSNTVRLLSPAPAVNPVLPAPNAPRVTVVPFTDNRPDVNLATDTQLGVLPDKTTPVGGIGLGTYQTAAEYSNIRISVDGEQVYASGSATL